MQTALNEYEVVKEQIDRSRIKRISWNEVFGTTLTKIVAGYYAEGKTATEAYECIRIRLSDMCIDSPEILRRLKIGVCARYGEITSERNRISEVMSR